MGVIGGEDLSCEEARANVEEAILLLALEPAAQLSVLPDFVVPGDELAIIFVDAVEVADNVCGHDVAWHSARGRLGELIDAVDDLPSEDKFLWEAEGVREDSRWQAIRSIAHKAASELGLPDRAPTLSWITFIEGRPEDG